MKSNQGLVFGAATIISGFSSVFCDQGTFLLFACLWDTYILMNI